MRPPLRYYLTTAAALLAILLCGYGVGFLVGEHLTQNRLGSSGGPRPPASWESTTLDRLTRELALTPRQQEQVKKEIGTSSGTIGRARLDAVRVYRAELLDLHQRLLPFLDEHQRKQVEESSRSLKIFLDERAMKGDPPSNQGSP